jgi:hypothetical protein
VSVYLRVRAVARADAVLHRLAAHGDAALELPRSPADAISTFSLFFPVGKVSR